MRIDSVELFHVALPLRQPFQSAAGPVDALETVLVRMQSGEAAGWGEASPGNAPLASPDWAAAVFGCLNDWLAPAVVGTIVDSGEALSERLGPFRGNQFAKAALDTAWWDLAARLQEKPLHELLGGVRRAVEVGVTFDRVDSTDDFLASIDRAFDAGFARVRVMFRPGWDIHMVDAVRKEFPTQTIHADVEGALDLDHVDILQRLDDFSLAMIEQPLPPEDLVGHAMVQESVSTPICLDESVTSIEAADMALELKSCRYMNIQPGRAGGLTPAVAIHDLAQAQGAACLVGAMPQSAIGTRLALALAAKRGFTYPADYFPSDDMLAEDLAEPPSPRREGDDPTMRIALWSDPGIGVEPLAEVLEKATINQARIV